MADLQDDLPYQIEVCGPGDPHVVARVTCEDSGVEGEGIVFDFARALAESIDPDVQVRDTRLLPEYQIVTVFYGLERTCG